MRKFAPFMYVLFISVLVFLTVQRPSVHQYEEWRYNRYSIECQGSVMCSYTNTNEQKFPLLEIGKNINEDYLIFSTIEQRFETMDGKEMLIKAIGIMGRFFPIIEKNVPTKG
ncbi:hypothetical protein [Aeribacillus pallidus]|uniref:hypothetical protein n=1 Tax=Aeribacillus pallidus TaxID=33936 RepID=UPI003D1C3D69